MVARSPADFRAAIEAHELDSPALAADALQHARVAVGESGMLVVGEPHGVKETPGVLHSLAAALDTQAVAFEWSHEEVDPVVQELVRGGSLDLEMLWSLGDSAEFFCGDGRITDVGGPMPSAPLAFRLPTATPAVVPAIGV